MHMLLALSYGSGELHLCNASTLCLTESVDFHFTGKQCWKNKEKYVYHFVI